MEGDASSKVKITRARKLLQTQGEIAWLGDRIRTRQDYRDALDYRRRGHESQIPPALSPSGDESTSDGRAQDHHHPRAIPFV